MRITVGPVSMGTSCRIILMFKNADRVVGKGSAKTTVYESIDGHDEKWSECFEEGSGGRGGKRKAKVEQLEGKTNFHNQSH